MSEQEENAALREAAEWIIRAHDKADASRLTPPPGTEWGIGWWYEPTGRFFVVLPMSDDLLLRLRKALGRSPDG